MVSELKKMQKLSMWAESSSSLILSNVVGLVPLSFKVPNIKTLRFPYCLNNKQLVIAINC